MQDAIMQVALLTIVTGRKLTQIYTLNRNMSILIRFQDMGETNHEQFESKRLMLNTDWITGIKHHSFFSSSFLLKNNIVAKGQIAYYITFNQVMNRVTIDIIKLSR